MVESLTVPFPAEPDESSLRNRLIIALDVPSAAAAQTLVTRIGNVGAFYKVGFQLFTAAGPQVVRDLVASGKRVFLDLKFHDIPNTVAGAVRSAAELGVQMLTVHAGGGTKMLKAAIEASAGTASPPKILAVTMLTSLDTDDLPGLALTGSVGEHVLRLAKLAQAAGCHGIVASPQEVAAIRKSTGSNLLIVTPGIRSSQSLTDDQARTATSAEALRAGATHLVVGRPIIAADDPFAAAQTILKEMATA